MPVLQKHMYSFLGSKGSFPGLNLSIDAAQEIQYSVATFLVFQLHPLTYCCDLNAGETVNAQFDKNTKDFKTYGFKPPWENIAFNLFIR